MIGRSDRARARVYQQLATMEKSGLPILRSVERIVSRGGLGKSMLAPVLREMKDGQDIGTAWASSDEISVLEARVVGSGGKSGALPETFNQLGDLYDDRAKTKVELVGSLAYPIFLVHMAILIPSIVVWFKDGLPAFLIAIGVPLGILYGATIGSFVVYRGLKSTSRHAVDGFLLSLPVIGGIVTKLSLSLSLKAMEAMYRNGVPIIEAVVTAGEVCPNRVLGVAFERIAQALRDGSDLGEAFEAEAALMPTVVLDTIATGATSGQLDEMLMRANMVLEDEAKQARKILIVILGGAAFAFAVLVVAYQVISFYSNLMGQATKAFG